MKKFAKQLLSFAVILSMVFGFSVLTFAAEPNTDNQVTETHSSYAVNSYSNASSYFEGKTNELKNSDTKIGVQPERIALSSENDRVRLEITSSLIAEGETQTFLGKVFAIHGNGYYDDKLILGDLGRNGKYSIAQFRVFSDNISNLTILVEDLDTGGLTEFSSHISQELFLELMNIADSNTTVAELAESQDSGISPQAIVAQEVIELMQPSKRFLHSINRRSLQSSSTFKSTSSYSAQSASADTLRDFCASLNDSISGSITVNGIMRNVLTQTGWKMYKTSSHFYVMHGVTNSSTEQLVGITVVSLSDYHPGTTQVNASYTIIGSCTLSYNPTTHVATRLQYDTGIRLEDAIIAIELVNGTTYFYQATKTWNLESSNSNDAVKEILVAISSKLGVASAIWSALMPSGNSSETIDFGSDTNQKNVYKGLIRAIANQTSSGEYLWSKDNSLGIVGLHYNTSTASYSSHRIAWGFTAYSLL